MLAEAVVILSGFDAEEEDGLKTRVEASGGRVQGNFVAAVTHVVAKHVKTHTYHEAIKAGVPVVRESWVAVGGPVEGHTLPPLAGHVVVTTGLIVTQEDKDEIQRLVEGMGGVYSGSLDTRTATVLVAREGKGSKFEAAMLADIPVVSEGWLRECMRLGHCIPTGNFPVKKAPPTPEVAARAPAPRKRGRSKRRASRSKAEPSEGGELSASRAETPVGSSSAFSLVRSMSESHVVKRARVPVVEATRMEAPPSPPPPSPPDPWEAAELAASQCIWARVRREYAGSASEPAITAAMAKSSGGGGGAGRASGADWTCACHDEPGTTELCQGCHVDRAPRACADFLDGANVLFVAVDDARARRLRLILRDGGGLASPVIDGYVTHVVAGPEVAPSVLKRIRAPGHNPPIVRPQWLVRCHARGELLEPEGPEVWKEKAAKAPAQARTTVAKLRRSQSVGTRSSSPFAFSIRQVGGDTHVDKAAPTLKG